MQRESIPAEVLTAQYRQACRQTDHLFALIRPAYLTARPVRERHRLLFYIGHLEAFDWNLLSARLFKLAPFAPDYDRLFAFGIDPVGGGLPTDQPEDWPTMAQIYAYRDGVRARIENAIPDVDFAYVDRGDAQDAVDRQDADPATLLQVAIEHRQMHAETLAYLIHQMPLSQKQMPDAACAMAPAPVTDTVSRDQDVASADARAGQDAAHASDGSTMVRIEAGDVAIGLPVERETAGQIAALSRSDTAGDVESSEQTGRRRGQRLEQRFGRPFGWDNEFVSADKQHVGVDAFWMDRHMVSNGDFLAFIAAGGYDDPRYWRPEDWAWRCTEGIAHPAFWRRDEGAWLLQTMFDHRALPLDWPVYVSHAEAAAYAQFVGKRLPTEAEWMRAAQGAGQVDQPAVEGNFDFRHWDPVPVRAYPENHSQFGVHGQFGNGWEWTADYFAPFPGFRAFSFYPGYSADFFDDRHFVMKGGSPRTASRMLRPTFRNWFQPHYPYVYAGFRCVSNASPDASLDQSLDRSL